MGTLGKSRCCTVEIIPDRYNYWYLRGTTSSAKENAQSSLFRFSSSRNEYAIFILIYHFSESASPVPIFQNVVSKVRLAGVYALMNFPHNVFQLQKTLLEKLRSGPQEVCEILMFLWT